MSNVNVAWMLIISVCFSLFSCYISLSGNEWSWIVIDLLQCVRHTSLSRLGLVLKDIVNIWLEIDLLSIENDGMHRHVTESCGMGLEIIGLRD